jgi:hypothetical protein
VYGGGYEDKLHFENVRYLKIFYVDKMFVKSTWADIQRRVSILAWIVILFVYGSNTIAEVKLLISPFLR